MLSFTVDFQEVYVITGFALYCQRRKLRGGSKIFLKIYIFHYSSNSKPCCTVLSFVFSSVLVHCKFKKWRALLIIVHFLRRSHLGALHLYPNSGWRMDCVGLSCPLGLSCDTGNCHFSHSTPGSPHLWNNFPITIHLNTVTISGCCSNFINFKLNWADYVPR